MVLSQKFIDLHAAFLEVEALAETRRVEVQELNRELRTFKMQVDQS